MNIRLNFKSRLAQQVKAFSLTELMVMLGVLVVIFALVWVGLSGPRRKSTQEHCVSRLKKIGLALRIYATDNGDSFPFAVSTTKGGTFEWCANPTVWPHLRVLTNELSWTGLLYCPMDSTRRPAKDFASLTESNISYFLGLTASETYPQSILAGDRTLMTNGAPLHNQFLEIKPGLVLDLAPGSHNGGRSFLFGDGSVQQFTRAQLAEHLKYLMDSTNRVQRWVFP